MERMTEKQVAKNTIEKLAIVVVTYRRQQLLATLFESIEKLTVAPWRIIVVDNEHSEATQGMVDDFREAVTAQWGNTIADQAGNESRVVYAPQSDNLGGAGGFSAGVKKAYELAAEHGYTFVHPFDDLDVATGQGSIAMEIIKELPTVDYILVPIGGGGLCTGVSTLAKLLNPLNPLAAIIASASILPPVRPTLTPRLAIKESIF